MNSIHYYHTIPYPFSPSFMSSSSASIFELLFKFLNIVMGEASVTFCKLYINMVTGVLEVLS